MATNTTSSFPDRWGDLYLVLDQPLDMDAFLKSDLFAAQRYLYMRESIAAMVSGSISFIASMLLVIHILRSHEYLSSTYHRLIFGLSVADVISSFSTILSPTMVPKEMGYIVPFASGNIATCDAFGFLVSFALCVSVGYNCAVCFYYLAIITYNKKNDYIQTKLEPWFHGISILIPLVGSVILLATNAFNGPNGSTCFTEAYWPPHCIGYEVGDIPEGYSIPCWRATEYDGHAKLRTIAMYGLFVWAFIIAPLTILVTMGSMYRSVLTVEKRMKKYGVSALRLRTTRAAPTTNNSTELNEARDLIGKMKKLVGKCLFLTASDVSQTNHRCLAICRFGGRSSHAGDGRYDPERSTRSTKSNKMKSQKRAVLYSAFGYAGAWFLVWTTFCFVVASGVLAKNFLSDTVLILSSVMTPLQGFFNFIVFMAPKVRTTRSMTMRRGSIRSSIENNGQSHQNLTWCQVIYKAYLSRGLEERSLRSSNRSERRSNRSLAKETNGSVRSIFGRMKSFAKSSIGAPSPDEMECLESGRSAAASP